MDRSLWPVSLAVLLVLGTTAVLCYRKRRSVSSKQVVASRSEGGHDAVITQLHVYPVKSMRVVDLKTSLLDKFGLKFDRRWIVYRLDDDSADKVAHMVTQRNAPRMATIQPTILRRHEAASGAVVYQHVLDVVEPGGFMAAHTNIERPEIIKSMNNLGEAHNDTINNNNNLNIDNNNNAPGTTAADEPSSSPANSPTCASRVEADASIVLRLTHAPDTAGLDASHIDVPLTHSGANVTVCVWDDIIPACIDQGDEVAEWLSTALQQSGVRLAFQPYASTRHLEQGYLPLADNAQQVGATAGSGSHAALKPVVSAEGIAKVGPDSGVSTALPLQGDGALVDALSFADGYSALVLSHESVEELNRRIAARRTADEPAKVIPYSRFRANVLVTAATASDADTAALPHNDEDTWQRFYIAAQRTGGAPLKVAGVTSEPLATMKTYRAGTSEKRKREVYMGMLQELQNTVFEATGVDDSVIAVGQRVVVTQRGIIGPT